MSLRANLLAWQSILCGLLRFTRNDDVFTYNDMHFSSFAVGVLWERGQRHMSLRANLLAWQSILCGLLRFTRNDNSFCVRHCEDEVRSNPKLMKFDLKFNFINSGLLRFLTKTRNDGLADCFAHSVCLRQRRTSPCGLLA